jgi:hypothetical protein
MKEDTKMTFEEKMKMWSEKKEFIAGINKVFQTTEHHSTVENVSYEVYRKQFEDRTGYAEWIIIQFVGGGISPVLVTGNSNTANFRVIGDRLNGGYYSEVENYLSLFSKNWELIV